MDMNLLLPKLITDAIRRLEIDKTDHIWEAHKARVADITRRRKAELEAENAKHI